MAENDSSSSFKVVSIPANQLLVEGNAPIVFVNQAKISTSPDETAIEFGLKLPDKPQVVNIVVTVVMTITHAKMLMKALEDQINAYEQAFGVVETDIMKRLSDSAKTQI